VNVSEVARRNGVSWGLLTLLRRKARLSSRDEPQFVRLRLDDAIEARPDTIDPHLVTFFDVLHDLGDPVGAAAHVRRSLKTDGAFMLMEPLAGDATEQNLGPLGARGLRFLEHGLRARFPVAGSRRRVRRASRTEAAY
jgi:hypothetical protein